MIPSLCMDEPPNSWTSVVMMWTARVKWPTLHTSHMSNLCLLGATYCRALWGSWFSPRINSLPEKPRSLSSLPILICQWQLLSGWYPGHSHRCLVQKSPKLWKLHNCDPFGEGKSAALHNPFSADSFGNCLHQIMQKLKGHRHSGQAHTDTNRDPFYTILANHQPCRPPMGGWLIRLDRYQSAILRINFWCRVQNLDRSMSSTLTAAHAPIHAIGHWGGPQLSWVVKPQVMVDPYQSTTISLA